MADPIAATIDHVYARSDTTVPTSSDEVGGLTDASYTVTPDYTDTNYLGGSGYKSRVQTLKDTSLDLSGQYLDGDTGQGVLKSACTSGMEVYVTIQFDANASAGSVGYRVPMKVSSYDVKLSPSGVVTFDAKLVGNGAPVAV